MAAKSQCEHVGALSISASRPRQVEPVRSIGKLSDVLISRTFPKVC